MSQIKSKYQHKQENFQYDLQYSVQMNTERTKMTEDFQKAIMQRNKYLARNAITMLQRYQQSRNQKYMKNMKADSHYNI